MLQRPVIVPSRTPSTVVVVAAVASLVAHVGLGAGLWAAGRSAKAEPTGDPAPQLAGATFELPAPEAEPVPLQNASPAPDLEAAGAAAESDPEGEPAEVKPKPPTRHTRKSERASHAGRPSAGRATESSQEASSAGGSEKLYGAVGDRAAVDLATAFRRSFVLSASANPVWGNVPLGSAGKAVVTLEIDDSGKLVGQHVDGSPSAALASGIRSTLSVLGGRSFTSRAKVVRLEVSVVVRTTTSGDAIGDVFGLDVGSDQKPATFSLRVGRKIDLQIRGMR